MTADARGHPRSENNYVVPVPYRVVTDENEGSTGRADRSRGTGDGERQPRVRMSDGDRRGIPLYEEVGFYLLVPGLLVFDWAAFRYLLGLDYASWYLANGAVIALGTAFVGRIWEEVESLGRPLISAHPVRYFSGCLHVAGLWLLAAGVTSPSSGGEREVPPLAESLDGILNVLVVLAIAGLVVGWLLFVAPMNYLVTLVSGSPAREYLRHPNARTIGLLGWRLDTRRQLGSVDLGEGRTLYVYEAGTGGRGELTESELETLEAARRRDERSVVELTFGRNPFGTTQTITAFVLFGIGWLV